MKITPEGIEHASKILEKIIIRTPLQYSRRLSEKFEANIYLKREDLQVVRSFKIRGAYNEMYHLSDDAKKKGIVCASAGNHAQGVAFACQHLNIEGKIFMPITTPQQKVNKVKAFGKDKIKVILIGDTYDDAYEAAYTELERKGGTFVHPFNDPLVIEGQGSIAKEILEDINGRAIDYCITCVGGGGLGSGLAIYFDKHSPHTALIGVEPKGAPAMYESIRQGKVIKLKDINPFVDGAAVQMVGDLSYSICAEHLDKMLLVDEGKICSTILELYNEDAIVIEPAGALAISSLDQIQEDIKGKTVVCMVSGGNNDITRMEDFKEKSLIFEGLKHYFIITFPQRAGALRDFLNDVLGPNDDITLFEYTKKTSRESGPALVGVELKNKEDYHGLIERMKAQKIKFQTVNDNKTLFDLLV